jgi:hypothetical protein
VTTTGRNRVAAAASALVASFAVVLAIGAFTGGSSSHSGTVGPVRLTVDVTAVRPIVASGRLITVLRIGSLTQTASGRVSSAGVVHVKVAQGSYLVCVSPPKGWRVAGPVVIRMPRWACLSRTLRAGRAQITLSLIAASGRAGV